MLEVGSSIAVNPKLSVGAADVQVQVEAEGLALQTEDPTFKQTIDQNEVSEMPLNGRQMTALIGLSGGANKAPGGDFTGSKFSYQAVSISIAGGAGNTTLWRLDGGDNQDYMGNANLPYPFPDAVSQFSVKTAPYGDGFVVTGGTRVIALCSIGTFRPFSVPGLRGSHDGISPFVQRSIAALIPDTPNSATIFALRGVSRSCAATAALASPDRIESSTSSERRFSARFAAKRRGAGPDAANGQK